MNCYSKCYRSYLSNIFRHVENDTDYNTIDCLYTQEDIFNSSGDNLSLSFFLD